MSQFKLCWNGHVNAPTTADGKCVECERSARYVAEREAARNEYQRKYQRGCRELHRIASQLLNAADESERASIMRQLDDRMAKQAAKRGSA
jgi:hypothetical protein